MDRYCLHSCFGLCWNSLLQTVKRRSKENEIMKSATVDAEPAPASDFTFPSKGRSLSKLPSFTRGRPPSAPSSLKPFVFVFDEQNPKSPQTRLCLYLLRDLNQQNRIANHRLHRLCFRLRMMSPFCSQLGLCITVRLCCPSKTFRLAPRQVGCHDHLGNGVVYPFGRRDFPMPKRPAHQLQGQSFCLEHYKRN